MKNAESLRKKSRSDEDLMLRFQAGDETAFEALVRKYQNRVHHFIYRYTKNTEDAEDLVQETFLRMYRSRNSYEPVARFSTWLFTIAINLVKSHYRKNSRMQTKSIYQDEEEGKQAFQLPCTAFLPDKELQSQMVLSMIGNAMNRLPEEFNELLTLREQYEMSYEEIAKIVDLPMGTVKSRINRGRTKLQESIKSAGEEFMIYAA